MIDLLRRWKRTAVIGALCLGAVVLGSLYAIVRTPSWYTPPVIAAEERQQVRNNLIAAEQAFTEHLREGAPFTYHVFQDDLNRWITMRRELYPSIDELAPHQLIDPFVLFDEGEITIAGRLRPGVVDVVLSIDIVPTIEDDALVLRAGAVRCGSVRVPMDFGKVGLGEHIERPREGVWPGSPRMWGDFLSGFHLETQAWWKNGGIEYRVLDVRIEPGRLNLKILPLGPHWARTDQD